MTSRSEPIASAPTIPACSCGGRRELRRRTIADGRVVAAVQCTACGRSASTPSRDIDLASLPAFEDDLQHRHWQEHHERERAARAARYDAYLRSPEWQAIRRKVLDRDRTCQGCLTRPATQVHHRDYSNVGHELLFQLLGLCEECHRQAHQPRTLWDDQEHVA